MSNALSAASVETVIEVMHAHVKTCKEALRNPNLESPVARVIVMELERYEQVLIDLGEKP